MESTGIIWNSIIPQLGFPTGDGWSRHINYEWMDGLRKTVVFSQYSHVCHKYMHSNLQIWPKSKSIGMRCSHNYNLWIWRQQRSLPPHSLVTGWGKCLYCGRENSMITGSCISDMIILSAAVEQDICNIVTEVCNWHRRIPCYQSAGTNNNTITHSYNAI